MPHKYRVELTLPQLNRIAEGLCELQAKHVLDLLNYLHQEVAMQDVERAADAQKADTPPDTPPPP